jgi:sulfhydrogenase subunit beta (sulfur reductase)
MVYKSLENKNLTKLFENMNKAGYAVFAPVKRGVKTKFSLVKSFEDTNLDDVQTTFSPKEILFPRVEKILSYKNCNGDVKIKNAEIPLQETVIFGVRPCDAVALEYLSAFFLNENTDYHFKKRKELTTIVTIGCTKSDPYCFCTSVGLSPGELRGSDVFMLDMGDGSYHVEVLTEKGEALIIKTQDIFSGGNQKNIDNKLANIPVKFDINKIRNNIGAAFDSPVWADKSLSCLGCGTCAFSCPTCSCFDIQEESNLQGGVRLRLWDTCAQGLFTLHASGHNPRELQSQRWRNRLMHKFDYSVKNLGMISCVGCGRCGRNCPAGMSIVENLLMVQEA